MKKYIADSFVKTYGTSSQFLKANGDIDSTSYLPLTGGILSGMITFQTSAVNNGFRWDVNSDAAGITFKNTGDGDSNSYFNFFTEDNGNEYFKFSHNTWNLGSFDWMDVKDSIVRVNGDIYVNASQNGSRAAGTNELVGGNLVWHSGNLTNLNQLTNGPGYLTASSNELLSSSRNLISNNIYSISIPGYQYTYGKQLVSADINRSGLSRGSSNGADIKIKSPGWYSISMWYKVENWVSGTSINPDINDTSLPDVVDISSNKSWTFYSSSVYVNSYIDSLGFFDLLGTFDATVIVSDIIITRSIKPSQQYTPTPEDYLMYKPDNSITSLGNITAPTFIGTLTGNASTAYALQNARNINGVAFDGTSNISIINLIPVSTNTVVETGRNSYSSGVYTYNVNNNTLGGSTPTNYWSVLDWGNGAGGSVQLAGNWTSNGDELWYRSLRDVADDWYDWKEILHSNNISSFAAPVSGSTNYIQNQNSSAQSANMWIDGLLSVGSVGNDAKLRVTNTAVNLSLIRAVGVNGSMLIDNVGSGNNYFDATVSHEFQIGGIDKFRIDNTGTATFASTVTATQLIAKSDNGGIVLKNAANYGWQMMTGWSGYYDQQLLIANQADGKGLRINTAGSGVFDGTVSASNGTLIGGTLTSNYIPKATGSGTLGNSRLIDNLTNNSVTFDDPSSIIKRMMLYNNNWTAGIQANSGDLQLLYNGYDIGVTLQNGKVGIGTISPSSKLEIFDVNPVLQVTTDPGQEGGASIVLTASGNASDNNAATIKFHNAASLWGRTDSPILRFGNASKSETWGVLGNNVGIGTTTPNEKLTVVGSDATTFQGVGIYNTYAYGNADKSEARFNLGKIEGDTYQPMGAIGAFPISNFDSSSGVLAFYSRADSVLYERARITSEGNFLIGGEYNNGNKFQVEGNSSFNGSIYATAFNDGYLNIGAAQINRTGAYVELQYTGLGGVKMFGNTGTPIIFDNNGVITGNLNGNASTSSFVTGLNITSAGNPIVNPDSTTQNQIGYTNTISLFGQSDGGLYTSAYSSDWQHQIFGDFRSGQIAIRGKNSNTWQSWRTVLDSSNFNNYAPTLTGTGASGIWGISISGNAATSSNTSLFNGRGLDKFIFGDTDSGQRDAPTTWSSSHYSQWHSGFWDVNGADWTPDSGWYWGNTTSHRSNSSSYNYSGQQVYNLNGTESYFRSIAGGNPSPWNRILHDNNIGSFAPTLTGAGASGTWNININGNSSSVSNGFYRTNPGSLDVDANLGTALYAGSTSGWLNQPVHLHNGNALLNIETHPGGYFSQLWFDTGGQSMKYRNINAGSAGNWLTMLHSENIGAYSPSLTGTGASGTWNINILGTAEFANRANRLDNANAYTNGTDGWFRSVGNAGWFNATYTTGIYSNANGEVRTYAGSNFVSEGNITAANNLFALNGISVGTAGTRTGALSTANAIAIGDTDTGFRQNGDGILETYANNVCVRVDHSDHTTFNVPIYGTLNGNASTSTSTPLLSSLGNYVWTAAMLPNTFPIGITNSFVRNEGGDNFPSYGSVMNIRSYSGGGGGALQMYTPYGPNYGGTGLKVRFGNYEDSENWTSWKTLLASDNFNSYAPSLTGSGASGTWGINITGTSSSISGYNNPTSAPTASTIVYRDSMGDISAREIVLSSGLSSTTPTVLVSMFPTTNQLVRTTPAAVATALSGQSMNIVGNASTSTNLTTNYIGGQQVNPQTYFGQNVGLKVAMTAVPSVWSDTLWINGYAGGDVLDMCALHFIRNGQPRAWISSQQSTATSYGTNYEFLTEYNFNSYAPTLTGTGASGTWNISATSLSSNNSIARTGSSGNYNTDFGNTPAGTVRHQGDDANSTNNPGGTWWFTDNYRHSNGSNNWGVQVSWGWEDNANRLATRNVTGGTFGAWVYYLNTSNFNTWSPTLTGNGASGTWGINVTGTSSKATNTVTGTNATDLVYGEMADNDQFRIRVGGTASNAGWAEIATADDGNEPIYVRQYTGVFATVTRTATLLDASGNTSFPGTLNIGQPVADTSAIGTTTQTIYSNSSIKTQQTTISQSDTNYYPMLTGSNVITGQGYTNLPSFGYMRPTGNLYGSGDVVIQNSGDGLPLVRWKFKGNGDFECPGTINAGGDVVAYYSSDRRLKDNIKPIENAIEKISKIGGYEFDWNDSQDVYSGHDIGVIAQEVEVVLPEVVITRENGYKAVKYEKMIALLIQGMKEQQLEIDELKRIINNK